MTPRDRILGPMTWVLAALLIELAGAVWFAWPT